MNKKGISPLISTVLIIGFTIVLAVLVITWISNTVQEQTDTTDCTSDAQNKCLNLVGNIVASTSNTTTDCTVDFANLGSEEVSSVSVVVYKDDGTTVGAGTTTAISPGDHKSVTITATPSDCVRAKYTVKVHSDVANGCDVECAMQEVEF